MSSYSCMYLIPKNDYNKLVNDAAEPKQVGGLLIRQLNNLDVNEGGKVTIRNDDKVTSSQDVGKVNINKSMKQYPSTDRNRSRDSNDGSNNIMIKGEYNSLDNNTNENAIQSKKMLVPSGNSVANLNNLSYDNNFDKSVASNVKAGRNKIHKRVASNLEVIRRVGLNNSQLEMTRSERPFNASIPTRSAETTFTSDTYPPIIDLTSDENETTLQNETKFRPLKRAFVGSPTFPSAKRRRWEEEKKNAAATVTGLAPVAVSPKAFNFNEHLETVEDRFANDIISRARAAAMEISDENEDETPVVPIPQVQQFQEEMETSPRVNNGNVSGTTNSNSDVNNDYDGTEGNTSSEHNAKQDSTYQSEVENSEETIGPPRSAKRMERWIDPQTGKNIVKRRDRERVVSLYNRRPSQQLVSSQEAIAANTEKARKEIDTVLKTVGKETIRRCPPMVNLPRVPIVNRQPSLPIIQQKRSTPMEAGIKRITPTVIAKRDNSELEPLTDMLTRLRRNKAAALRIQQEEKIPSKVKFNPNVQVHILPTINEVEENEETQGEEESNETEMEDQTTTNAFGAEDQWEDDNRDSPTVTKSNITNSKHHRRKSPYDARLRKEKKKNSESNWLYAEVQKQLRASHSTQAVRNTVNVGEQKNKSLKKRVRALLTPTIRRPKFKKQKKHMKKAVQGSSKLVNILKNIRSSTHNSPMQLPGHSSAPNSPMQLPGHSSVPNSPMQLSTSNSARNSPMQISASNSIRNSPMQISAFSSARNSPMQISASSSARNSPRHFSALSSAHNSPMQSTSSTSARNSPMQSTSSISVRNSPLSVSSVASEAPKSPSPRRMRTNRTKTDFYAGSPRGMYNQRKTGVKRKKSAVKLFNKVFKTKKSKV